MFTAGAPELAAHPPAVVEGPQPVVTQVDEQAVTVMQLILLAKTGSHCCPSMLESTMSVKKQCAYVQMNCTGCWLL